MNNHYKKQNTLERVIQSIILMLLILSISNSQSFTEVPTTFRQLFNSSASIGDFDNDKDLDVLIMGTDGSNEYTSIYSNSDGIFIERDDSLIGAVEGNVEWGDYNNDGTLDILQTGLTDTGYVIQIYKNQNNSFITIPLNVINLRSSHATWVDFDNDGDLDIFYTGITTDIQGLPVTLIIQNQGQDNFITNDTIITAVNIINADFGDYDKDGDLDLVCTRTTTPYPSFNPVTEIYTNNNCKFEKVDTNLPGVIRSCVSWVDYDQDGYLDLFIAGELESGSYISKVYKNHDGVFTDINASITGVSGALCNWGDYDNDGDLDLLLAGFYDAVNNICEIFENNGNDTFSSISAGFMGVWLGTVLFFDYDNDNDMDVLITGDNFMGPGNLTKLYRNEIETPNAIALPPTNLINTISKNSVVLSWNHGTDQETFSTGLTYNLRIGNHSGKGDILNSMADTSGYRKIVSRGNIDYDTSWTINNLNPGTYYWSVQSIDNNFSGSKFSAENIFSTEFTCDFSSDIISGDIPLTVHLSDSTRGIVTSWQWDFENDGIIDSYEQNPSWTYTEADSYSVKLIVSNAFESDTLLKENYIVAFQDTFPNLYSINDIPNDQGGWVKVQFAGSAYDTDSLIFPKAATAELYTVEIDDGSGWTAAASTSAYSKNIYSVLVPTTKDSTDESDGLINFRVIAAMNEGNYASNEMTGYSVDNLAPAVPQALLAKQSGTTIELSWQENSENDFKYYTIYKSTDNAPMESIATAAIPQYLDTEISADDNYAYAISATDHSGNESALSEVVNLTVTTLDELSAIPDKYYLGQNFPNPFNPTTVIKYGLPRESKVALKVYDITGREIMLLVNSIQSAGNHKINFDGSSLAGGIYFYKLTAGSFEVSRKMLLLR